MSRLPGFIKDFGCWFRKVRGHEVRETTLVPPPELQFVGEGDFAEVGNEFLKHFIKLAHLQPNENVLDVGCGVGRVPVRVTSTSLMILAHAEQPIPKFLKRLSRTRKPFFRNYSAVMISRLLNRFITAPGRDVTSS